MPRNLMTKNMSMMITIMTIMTMMQHMILLMKKVQHLSKTKHFKASLFSHVRCRLQTSLGDVIVVCCTPFEMFLRHAWHTNTQHNINILD